jgi:hypothetical protein
VTGGSQRGPVVSNTVRETGDDMIAVVSYVNDAPAPLSASAAAASLSSLRDRNLTRDILIADNDVAGQYWGRGISVVGGEDIAILRNTIDATTHAAGVYLAREQAYGTFGVRNVRVEDNRITRVQTTAPAYVPAGASAPFRTGHGAIELVATQYDEEAAQAALRDELVVRRVRVAHNRIDEGTSPGMRIGYGYGQRWSSDGTQRGFGGATVTEVGFDANTLTNVLNGIEVFNDNDPALALSCAANSRDGAGFSHPNCRSAPHTATGASRTACAWTR